MARAKHTVRAEARRRYRQTANLTEDDAAGELDEGTLMAAAPAKTAPQSRPAQTASGRPGFLSAFRDAYHPAHLREDLRALPKLLTSRALLAGLALVLVGAVAAYAFPGYTGSAFAWELLVLPGSALGPQLLAGFFAPRASYLLGLIVGLFQGLVFSLFLTLFASRLGTELPADKVGSVLTLSFVTGPVSGTLFAAAAAWYRRFLALSSPKRSVQGRGGSGRPAAKAAPSKRGGR
ncbi:MAG: hypothetical protein ABI620_08135 [Chloroflexota bacterium]